MHRLTAKPAVTAILAGLTVLACSDSPVTPPDVSTSVLGRGDGTVTVPFRAEFTGGTFVVVPFGDPRIPEGTPTDCPVGEANPDLGIPAGFPNGGGVVVLRGTGEATHLGRFQTLQTRCAVQFFPETDPAFVNFDVRSTLTGAAGDQIFSETPFAVTPFSEVSQPDAEIVGGTGRFEDATGQLSPFEGDVTCTDGTPFCLEGTFTGGGFEGEITIPRP